MFIFVWGYVERSRTTVNILAAVDNNVKRHEKEDVDTDIDIGTTINFVCVCF